MRTSFLIELMVGVVIIGVASSIMVPRFITAKDRARIAATESEVTKMREALGLYVIDWATYKTSVGDSSTDYVAWKASVVDRDGNAYTVLPDSNNFDLFSFHITASDTTFLIQVTARDAKNTTVYGTPEKTWY